MILNDYDNVHDQLADEIVERAAMTLAYTKKRDPDPTEEELILDAALIIVCRRQDAAK